MHATVNEYGGFYEKAPIHHKELEQLETRYVLDVHKDLVDKARTDQDYTAGGPTFAEFILNAYRKTYPAVDVYTKCDPSYYCARFNEAAGNCTAVHQGFYQTATTKDQKGVHTFFSKARMLFPNMPSFDDYDAFNNAIEITDLKAEKDKITATVKIHDDKGYGRFMSDWEVAANDSIKYAQGTFALLSTYLDAKTVPTKDAARKLLVASVPSKNLDQPSDTFDYTKTIPGDKPWRRPSYKCVITPVDKPGNAKTVTGRLEEIKVLSTRWSGSEDGEVKLEIPIPAGAYPYEFELSVATFGLNDLLRPDYERRAWARQKGSSDTEGEARITVGEVFDTSVTVPLNMSNLPGIRQWLIMDERPDDRRILMNGKVKTSPTQFTQSFQSVGKLPGNREFFAVLASHRYDVTVVEEKLDGVILSSKLQLSDPSLAHHFGPQYLVCVFLDHPQSGSMEYMTARQKWQKSNKEAGPIWDAIDAVTEKVSEAKRNELQNIGMAYQAELDAKNLPEQEKNALMEAKYYELLGTVGLKLTPEQVATLNIVKEDQKSLDAVSNIYNCAFGKVIVLPCVIKVEGVDAYVEDARDTERDIRDGKLRRVFTTIQSTAASDKATLSTAEVKIDITCSADPKLEADFIRFNKGEQTKIAVGDFVGTFVENTNVYDETRDNYSAGLQREYLLKKGGTYVNINITVSVSGYRHTNMNGDEIGNGISFARSNFTKLSSEAKNIVNSFRLIMTEVPAAK